MNKDEISDEDKMVVKNINNIMIYMKQQKMTGDMNSYQIASLACKIQSNIALDYIRYNLSKIEDKLTDISESLDK